MALPLEISEDCQLRALIQGFKRSSNNESLSRRCQIICIFLHFILIALS